MAKDEMWCIGEEVAQYHGAYKVARVYWRSTGHSG